MEKLSASILDANKIAAEILTLSQKKIEQDKVHKITDIVENLKVQLMTAKEK